MQDVTAPAPKAADDGRDVAGDAGEALRLATLERSGLLGTGPEDAFDRATRLATRIARVPVGLLSFVAADRQVFKAAEGLGPDGPSETPLSHSFCKYVVRRGAPLRVTDARLDPLVRENDAVADLNVIAYLGVPVRAPDGAVLGSFCAIDHVPRDWTDADLAALQDLAAGIESEIAARFATVAARENEMRLAQVLESTADGIARLDAEWRFTYLNANARAIIGQGADLLGRSIWDVFPVAIGGPYWESLHHARDTQEPQRVTGLLVPLDRWIEARSFPVGDEVTVFFRDVTEARRTEDSRQLLVRELNHRVKNLFAIVSGMVGLTARQAPDVASMTKDLRGRIAALAAAHELIRPAITLEETAGMGVTLDELLAAVLRPHAPVGAAHVAIDGPQVLLGPAATTSLALALHELATNAAKHGALRPPEGHLAIAWNPDGDRLAFTWSERAVSRGPEGPATPGFGTSLLRLSVEAQLGGEIETAQDPGGLRVALSLPLSRLAA